MWRGSFKQLVERVNEKLQEQGDDQLVNERLLRSYQHKGLLGRGTPLDGRTMEFTEDDVLSVLATRGLMKSGVGLNLASALLEQSTPDEYAFLATTTYEKNNSNDIVDKKASSAVDKVAELMRRTTQPPSLAYSTGKNHRALQSFSGNAIVQQQVAEPSLLMRHAHHAQTSGQMMRDISLGHGARLTLPEPMTEQEKQDVVKQLEKEIKNLQHNNR